MSLLSLNDDVLLAIFATLYGKDALHVSLTSKRAYTLAGPCIASRIECTSPKRLRRIHTYLLAASSDGGLRARFLKFLWIDRGAFEDPLAECPYDHPKYDFSQVHLVREILLQASNLRELWIAGFQACIERDARIWDIIQSLTGLVDLQLFDVTDSSLTIFDSFRSDYLTRLTLTYRRSRSKAEIPISPLPSLPSIRHLRLHEPTMFALDLVGRCPNLSALIVSFIQKTQPRDLPRACGGSQWPSLRRLMVSELQDVRSFSERLRTVGSLQICGMLDCRSGGDLALLEVLRQTSPVGLYVSIQTSCQEPLFWDAIPSAAPRLRSLELQLQRPSGCSIPEAYSWLVCTQMHYLSIALTNDSEQAPRCPQLHTTRMPPRAGSRTASRPAEYRLEGSEELRLGEGDQAHKSAHRIAVPAGPRHPFAAIPIGGGFGAKYARHGRPHCGRCLRCTTSESGRFRCHEVG